DEWLLQKARKSRRDGSALLHVLQFLARPSDAPRNASDGSGHRRSRLERRGNRRFVGLEPALHDAIPNGRCPLADAEYLLWRFWRDGPDSTERASVRRNVGRYSNANSGKRSGVRSGTLYELH